MLKLDPTAFDALAATYDDDFTGSPLGRLLRSRVWTELGRHFSAGQHVLELACGTGEDAVWLARRGVRVTATDGSAEMARLAQAKARAAGVTAGVRVEQVALQALAGLETAGPFDGAYANFGGLNTLDDWRPLAETLAGLVRPGGRLVLVVMGPFCPWEMAWHLAHGQPRQAFRRWWHSPATARVGTVAIPVWYPPARRLRDDFTPDFVHLYHASLGFWLPPSYLAHLVKRWPGLFGWLNRLETASAGLTFDWGDHYIVVFERR